MIFFISLLCFKVCIVPPCYSRLRDLLPAAVGMSVLPANFQGEPKPQGGSTPSSESSSHWGRSGPAVPCSAGTLRRGCATSNPVTTKVQSRPQKCPGLTTSLSVSLENSSTSSNACWQLLYDQPEGVLEQAVGMKKRLAARSALQL